MHEFEKVYVGNELPSTEEEIVTIRIRPEGPVPEDYEGYELPDYKFVLEVKVECASGHDNWIAIGTDAGEYRCTTCTEWL